MVNADEEMALGYLIDPCFELTNTAGKPLTEGWINVYVHGTRNKYYCYSDWNGNLHPFNIPLDGLGSNIVLASPQFTYDVYVYNKYGSLQMSRYNVSPVGVGEVSVSGINEIVSNDGTVEVTQYGDTFNLSVPDITAVSGLVEDVEELNAAVTAIQEDIENLSTAVSGKKDKQEPYSFSGNARQTVSYLSQNANGDVSVGATKSVGSEYTVVHSGTTSNKFAKIAEFPCYSGFSYVGSGFTNLVVSVSDAGGARQAMISVGITQAANGNHNFAAPLRYYVSVNQSSTMELKKVYLFSDKAYGNSQVSATISLWAEFTDLSQKQWTFKAENNYATPGTGGTPKANAWEFANGQRYAVSELPTGGWQLNSQDPMYSTQTPDWNETNANARSYIKNKPDMANYVTQQQLATAVVQSDWEQSDNTKPDYIKNKPDMSNYVTQEELVTAVSGLGAQSDWNEQDSDSPAYIKNKPDMSEYVTQAELVTAVSGLGVQSDWTEQDSESPAYIQNKPEEKDLVAGDGIDITVSGTSVIISSDNPVVTGYVTEAELATVSGTLQLEIDTVSANPRVKTVEYGVDEWSDVVAAMNGVSSGKYDYVVMKYTSNGVDLYAPLVKYEAGSAAYFVSPANVSDNTAYGYGERRITDVFIINSGDLWVNRRIRPFQGRLIGRGNVSITVQGEDYIVSGVSGTFEQVNSDWNAVSGVAEILNKPETVEIETVGVSAGSGIAITEVASGIVISCTVTGGGSTYTAGDNIDITNDVISVTDVGNLVAGSNVGITVSGDDIIISASGNGGASYTAGDNIDITNDVISVTGTSDLIAGNNITITASGTDYIISSTGEPQVQANWNETDTSSKAYIQNKPTIHTYTAGDNINIASDVISVTGTGELLAGSGITIAASGSNYVISSTGDSSDIFIATYNVTSFADVLDAYNDGKTIICKYPVTDVDDYLSCIYVGTFNQQIVKFDFSLAAGSTLDNNVSVTQASISYYTGWSVHTTVLNQPVQSNWNESNSSALSYIQNKPTIHTYSGASGIDITNDVISLDDPINLVAGSNITIEVTGVSAIISSTGGGGTTYTAGTGIDISNQDVISVKIDGSTITTNGAGQLVANGGGTTYTAGNMISLSNNAISVSTTAGITDIQKVAALPASPVSSVLYLIPEV